MFLWCNLGSLETRYYLIYFSRARLYIYTHAKIERREARDSRVCILDCRYVYKKFPGFTPSGTPPIPSRSILHFPRLTFLTPPDAALHGEYIRLAFEENVFLWRKTRLQSINSWNEMYTRSRKESRQVDSI